MMGAATVVGGSAVNNARSADQSEASQSHTITIAGMAFSPLQLHVHAGDTVVFQNKDIFPHTATAPGPQGFDSSVIKPGGTWSTTLKHVGDFRFACQFHPEMKGEIVVEK